MKVLWVVNRSDNRPSALAGDRDSAQCLFCASAITALVNFG